MNRFVPTAVAALPLAAMSLATPAAADPVADFYNNRQVNLVVAFPAGGMYGLTAQLDARYFGKHIPGNPNLVPQYMTGAGGTKAANYVYNAAARDGGVLAELSKDLAVSQRLEPNKVKYDAAKFNYIGRVLPYVAVLMVWHTAGINTVQDLKTKQLILGSSGKSSHEYAEAMLLNQMAGTKIKVVLGYSGAAPMYQAMESGEIQARMGAWDSLKSVKRDWLKKKLVSIPLQMGLTRASDLPNVPTILELARTDEERQMVEVIEAGGPLGWAIQAPPGVPKARLNALRKAFDAMVKDPEFIADAKKRNVEIDPATGAEIQKSVEHTLAISPKVVDKLRKIAGYTN
jgi:tripartite-type tricarboxylate transporter receptor subunit TctC